MIATLLLAQILAAAPATTATPVIKADTGQTRTLADVARERKLGVKGVQGGTMSVAGAPAPHVMPVLMAGQSAGQPESGGALTRADSYDAWTARRQAIQAEADAANTALSQADSTIPSVTCRNPNSAACIIANETRESGLLQYRMKVNEAEAKMNKLREEASKAGVPGLVR